MNANKEREYVKAVYPNAAWSKKVDSMADDQVIAIYLRLKQSEPQPEPDDHPDQQRLF
jgi:hypothetical protein